MTIKITISQDEASARVDVVDVLTKADLRELFLRLYRDMDSHRRCACFVDMSGLIQSDVGFNELLGYTERVSEAHAGAPTVTRVAVYAPDDVAFGIGRMYQQLFDRLPSFEVCVTRDRDEACAWLAGPDAFRSSA